MFLGLIVRLNGKFPPVLSNATADKGKRCRGRPFRIIRDALIENLSTIIPNVDSKGRGKINDWIGCALEEKELIGMVKGRMRKENVDFQHEPETNAND